MDTQTITTTENNLPKPLTILLESTVDELMQVIASVKAEDFNRVLQAGSWTPAQQLEHLRLSVQGAVATLNGPAKDTTRSPDQFADVIKGIFLDFEAKYPAATSLVPDDKDYDKTLLTNELLSTFNTLKEIIRNQDLTGTCLEPEFPGIGLLTRLERSAKAGRGLYERQIAKLLERQT